MHDRNQHLGRTAVKPYSHVRVWWSCPNCPDGHVHIWEALVSKRSQGTGCPYCSGQKVCKHNSLATKAPEVVRYWHPQKNLPLSPETVTAQGEYRAHWICSACSHEWRTSVNTKALCNSGCPHCARANAGRSKDGVRQKHPTFASCKHHLLSQWDHSLNAREGNYPDNTTLGSNKPIWWTCDQCPRGKKHSWQAAPYDRTRQRPRGCPFCSGRKVCECNSLQTVYPDIAADFDIVANGLTAAQVTASATIKYKWLSDKPGDKMRSVAQRTTYAQSQTRRPDHVQAGGMA